MLEFNKHIQNYQNSKFTFLETHLKYVQYFRINNYKEEKFSFAKMSRCHSSVRVYSTAMVLKHRNMNVFQ